MGGVCHGGVSESERLHLIQQRNPVIAIMQLGKQALNKPSLDTLFVCEPFRKEGMLQQTMGRVLRNFQGKKEPVIVIYEDIHITPLRKMCQAVRRTLARWPKNKGGRIEFKTIRKPNQ
jgi:superfamily II DNA or RNA helicase